MTLRDDTRTLQRLLHLPPDGIPGPITIAHAIAAVRERDALNARTAPPRPGGTLGLGGGVSGAGGAPSAPESHSAATYDLDTMIAELRRDEGERLQAYLDTVGKWTIGVGRNLDDVGTAPLDRTVADVKVRGITAEESAKMLGHDLARVEADLDRRLPWWRSLDPVRQRVLVNMAFNLGIGGLLGFTNTLAMVERGSYVQAAKNMMLSKWATQVGKRAQRLSDMMRDGK